MTRFLFLKKNALKPETDTLLLVVRGVQGASCVQMGLVLLLLGCESAHLGVR